MKRYLVTGLVLLLVMIIFVGYPQRFTQSGAAAGQRRGTRRPAPTPTAKKPGIDYSTFSHATKEHKGACNTCHKVPTANWKKVRQFPDVADFPDHAACVRCHRNQFFRGPQPVIWSELHDKSRSYCRSSFYRLPH